jgi:hypothetical protein
MTYVLYSVLVFAGKRDMLKKSLHRVGSFDKLAADLPSYLSAGTYTPSAVAPLDFPSFLCCNWPYAADNVLSRPLAASGEADGAAEQLLSQKDTKQAMHVKPATYAGLSNQGATCYMNSLLQTLFMTPEFRRVLYLWRYNPVEDDDEADCIPLQLQLLFGQLQLTELRAIPTTVWPELAHFVDSPSFTATVHAGLD